MDYSLGYTTSYHMGIVDPTTWADGKKIEIDGGSINKSDSGLRESANIECTNYSEGSDKWIRIWMDVEQGGASDNNALFTGIVSSPEIKYDGNIKGTPLECYSVLKPVQDVYLPRGWYAAKGFDASEVIKKLLSVSPAPVVVNGESPKLSQHIVAEDNETNLSMVEKILTAIGWRLRIQGDGTIVICPKATEESVFFGNLTNDCLEQKVNIKADYFDCPNVFRAVTDTLSITVKDNSDSPLSIESRGREVWSEESSVKLGTSETLYSYAERRLKELQTYSKEVSYDRSYWPDVYPTDMIRLSYPEQSLKGLYIIESQKIALDHSGTITEEVREA